MHTTIIFYQILLCVHMSLPCNFQEIYKSNPEHKIYTYYTHPHILTHAHTYRYTYMPMHL